MEATLTKDVLRCGECDTENRAGARFCKGCGGAIAAPPTCPKCSVAVAPDAKFCVECGAKLVGARPEAAPPEKKPATAPAAVLDAAADAAADAEVIKAEAAKLPAARRAPSSNIGSNLLFVVAIIMGIITVIYMMNKGEPKSVSPFAGGPPPGAQPGAEPAAPPPPAGGAAPAAATTPIRGKISLSKSLQNEGKGTIFLIVRNQGMPNRGPPVAAKKLDASTMPVEFTLGPSDVMMPGMTFTGPFDLYARLDGDGNAMTKEPGDIVNKAPHSGSKPGDTTVEIVLDSRL